MEDGPLPSLEEIQNITDINEAKALLLATVSYEKKIEQDLESFLQNSSELESRLESVEDIPLVLIFNFCILLLIDSIKNQARPCLSRG